MCALGHLLCDMLSVFFSLCMMFSVSKYRMAGKFDGEFNLAD